MSQFSVDRLSLIALQSRLAVVAQVRGVAALPSSHIEVQSNIIHSQLLALRGRLEIRPGITLAWDDRLPSLGAGVAAYALFLLTADAGEIRVSTVPPEVPALPGAFFALITLNSAALGELLGATPAVGSSLPGRPPDARTLGFTRPLTPRARLALDSLRRCPFSGVCRDMALSARGHDLLVEFLSQWAESKETATQAIGPTDRVRAAAEILAQQFEHPPSLGELAATVGLSESTLKRGFNQVFGTTVFGYIRARRMEHARLLLESGRATVLEAATLVGYANPSNFATAFRRQFGINPKAFQLGARAPALDEQPLTASS